MTAMACERLTEGNPSKKSSMDSPPSRASIRFCRGTRAPKKKGRAAHDFGIGVDDAFQFQIFQCHNMNTPAGKIVTCKQGREPMPPL
jgi:hypothetical protein